MRSRGGELVGQVQISSESSSSVGVVAAEDVGVETRSGT